MRHCSAMHCEWQCHANMFHVPTGLTLRKFLPCGNQKISTIITPNQSVSHWQGLCEQAACALMCSCTHAVRNASAALNFRMKPDSHLLSPQSNLLSVLSTLRVASPCSKDIGAASSA